MLGVTSSDITNSLPAAVDRIRLPPHSLGHEAEEVRVRQQAAEIAAALGHAALEIIAEFRAQRWASIAERKQRPAAVETARKRSIEWQRIAAAVSLTSDPRDR